MRNVPDEAVVMLQKGSDASDWWWHLRFGMCYYRLGLFQEAIRQAEKSLALHPTDDALLFLNKCYLRIDQPLVSAKMFHDLSERQPGAPCLFGTTLPIVTMRFESNLVCASSWYKAKSMQSTTWRC